MKIFLATGALAIAGVVTVQAADIGPATAHWAKLGGRFSALVYYIDKPDGFHVVVTTQQLKIYATGKGTKVDKDDVLAAMIKRYPDVEIAGNDGADALALAALGAHYFGCRLRPVPQTHERALAMVAWPLWVQEMKEARDGASDHPSA